MNAQVQLAHEEEEACFLPFWMADIPLDRILIPDEEEIRVTQDTIESVREVGILHAPIVEQIAHGAIDSDGPLYRVVDGRKRCKWAKAAELGLVHCKVYAELSDEIRSVFILNTNWNRSPSWVIELQALHRLSTSGIGMTDRQIARKTGVNIATVREHLKLVQLPEPILEAIFGNKMSKDTAKRAARLSPKQQARLATAAIEGAEITPELVKAQLRGQIDTGLEQLSNLLSSTQEINNQNVKQSTESVSYSWMIGACASWEKKLAGHNRAVFLLAAFKQELEILERQNGAKE